RILLGARRELTTAKTRTINRLRALLLTGSDADRALSRGALTSEPLRRPRGGKHEPRNQAVRRAEARRLALAISGIDRELADNKCHLADLVTHFAPQLLAKRGVGPVSAAQAIVSWSHPGRCRNDAAYAALAGASPIPASSGRIVRRGRSAAVCGLPPVRHRCSFCRDVCGVRRSGADSPATPGRTRPARCRESTGRSDV